jgi:tRNA1Val (adenine37-N6)-methyltransferase
VFLHLWHKLISMFRYKQFTIRDENTAMKVGTDGTLLGCWVNVRDAKSVLDVGAGTGVIGIMCAQKNESCRITSLEIDEGALVDAVYNVSLLPEAWKSRIEIKKCRLQDFLPNDKIDVIVSNPPFFENSQLNQDESKTKARHTSSLHYEEIMEFSQHHLSNKGTLSLILPYSNGEEALKVCDQYGLFPSRICEVKPVPNKNSHRLLLTFGKQKESVEREYLTIETGIKRHEYTTEYIALGKDFYLYF